MAPFNFVRAWRKGRGWTLEELAFRIGTTKATISRIENRRQGITGPVGDLLTDEFGTTLAVLYSRGPTPEELGVTGPDKKPDRPARRQ